VKEADNVKAFKPVRGMRDFLPEDAFKMRYAEQVSREIARLYGYEEVITPVLESHDLLAAKAGEEIRLRMYAFTDMGGRKVALRPEFTPSIARLVATKLRNAPKPLKLFCVGSLYRYDEPQQGRFREFWQANYELMGSSRPEADAEILTITDNLLQRLGVRNYWFKIGHMGVLRGILGQEEVAEEQQNRILHLLDTKRWDEALKLIEELNVSNRCITTVKEIFETKGKNASQVLEKAKKNVQGYENAVIALENLRDILDLARNSGVKFKTLIEMGYARGLEYYTGMIFEPYAPELDIALGGGGRYDRLIELFGGEPTPAVGVAQGVDRIVLATEKQKAALKAPEEKRVIVVPLSRDMLAEAFKISSLIRAKGILTETEMLGRSASKVLSHADKRGFDYALLVGAQEVKSGKIVLRDMKKREQKTVKIGDVLKEIMKKER